ncbi:hypothetical protein ACFL5W_00840 [Thermodesulfobacteriota bacterium]
MSNAIMLLKAICVLVAAALIGNWFLAELRKTNTTGRPWYKTYLTLPGLLILFAVMIPVILWFMK